MINNIKNYLYLILYWAVAFVASSLIVYFNFPSYNNYTGTSFQFTFIGVLLGFSLTLFNHIVGQIEKMQNQFKDNFKPEEKQSYDSKMEEIEELSKEIKEDVKFLFSSLIIIVMVSIFSPIIKDKMFYFLAAHIYDILPNIKDSFLLSVFFLCLYAIWDLVSVSLRLSEKVILGNNKEKK